MLTALRRWLDQRFGFGPIYRGFLDRRVPRTAWYHGDGMALLTLLTVLFVTGPVLALSYCPSLPEANASVRYITEGQFLGWFVRGLHYWAAGLFVAMVGFHLFRQILVGGYKFPREGNWLIGVVMLFLILPLSVIGYTLRWDADGLYGLKVALHMFSRVPVIGDELVVLVQGGTELTSRTLTRLYAAHVVLGPLILLALVSYHLYLIVTVGVTSPVEERQSVHSVEEQQRLYHESAADPQQGETFFPETIGRLSGLAGVMFVLALGLAAFVGPPEAAPAGDLHTATHPAEEWWLSWFSGMVALLPPSVAPWFVVVFPAALFVVLVLLPFVDRSPARGIRNRPWAVVVVAVSVIAILALTSIRLRSAWGGWPSAEPPPVPPGVVLPPEAEAGRIVFARYGCNSCHTVAGHGNPHIGPDLARMSRRMSLDELRRYILRPPEGVAMPAYAGRISEEDLDRVAGFVLVVQTYPR